MEDEVLKSIKAGNGLPPLHTTGERLRRLLKESDMTSLELANRIGTSTQTVSAWLTNKSKPKRRRLYNKLADCFGVDVDYIMCKDINLVPEQPTIPPVPVKLETPEDTELVKVLRLIHRDLVDIKYVLNSRR